jgi:hypothetical protein
MAREWRPKEVSEKKAAAEAAPTVKRAPPDPELIRDIQKNLAALGYNPGPADGQMGARTRTAISRYQQQAGLAVDGKPSRELLEHLQQGRQKRLTERQETEKPSATSPSAAEIGKKATPDQQLQEVMDQLKELVEKGSSRGMASEQFLSELRGLVLQYDWPWRTLLFQDDFTDGNHTSNPAWSVASGDFWVDSSLRLRTDLQVPETKKAPESAKDDRERAAQIFGAILSDVLTEKQDESSVTPQPTKAEIYSALKISNHFSMEFQLQMLSGAKGARIEFGPYQGDQRDRGYRLNYLSGENPTLELRRFTRGGSSVIEVSSEAPRLDDGKQHNIQWRRYEDGVMSVLMDSKELMRTVDRAFRSQYQGLTIINHAGDYAISSVIIYGSAR